MLGGPGTSTRLRMRLWWLWWACALRWQREHGFTDAWPVEDYSQECTPFAEESGGSLKKQYSCESLVMNRAQSFYINKPWIADVTIDNYYVEAAIDRMHIGICPRGSTDPCHANESVVQPQIGYGRTWTHIGAGAGTVFQRSLLVSGWMTCFPRHDQNEKEVDKVSIAMLASTPIHMRLNITWTPTFDVTLETLDQSTSQAAKTKSIHFGGEGEASKRLLTFYVSDDAANYERLSFKVTPDGPDQGKGIYAVYVFNTDSNCIRKLISGSGCANPQDIIDCLGKTDVTFSRLEENKLLSIGQHASYESELMLTLSTASVPQRKSGRWFALMTCEPPALAPGVMQPLLLPGQTRSCAAARIDFTHTPEYNAKTSVALGYLFMVLVPICVLLFVDAVAFLAYRWLLSYEKHSTLEEAMLWPAFVGAPDCAFMTFLWNYLVGLGRPTPFFAALLQLMVGVFVATAGQFVVTHWWLMQRSGDHDFCFYNEGCYYPGLHLSIPLNNMLSHIPYILAGLHVFVHAFFAEHKIQTFVASSGYVLKYPLDLRPFHALALSYIAEGLGSASYHVCPALETFQFDTCFMIPIAHLLCIVLADWPRTNASNSRALKYFLYIISPIWLFNFVGTWYDSGLAKLEGWRNITCYCFFAATVIIWSFFALRAVDYLLQMPKVVVETDDSLQLEASKELTAGDEEDGESADAYTRGRCGIPLGFVLKLVVFVALAASVIVPSIRAAIGGMANTFLVLSILIMICVVGWQVEMLSRSPGKISSQCVGRTLMKFSYNIILFPLAVMALWCFGKHVAIVEPGVTAAESHAANRGCVVSIFDMHDVWHLLGALALAITGMFLLDFRVHSFARINALGVIGADGLTTSSESGEGSEE